MKDIIEEISKKSIRMGERAKERKEQGVEVPYMKWGFCNWLKEQGVEPEGIDEALESLDAMDNDAFLLEEDFYTGLPIVLEPKIEKVIVAYFSVYENILDRLQSDADKEGNENVSLRIFTWRAVLGRYKEYFLDVIKKPFCLFKGEDFVASFPNADGHDSTPKQYVADIKRLNKDFFFAQGYVDFWNELQYLFDTDQHKALVLLEDMEGKLLDAVKAHQLDHITKNSLDNYQTAFHQYVEFMKSLILGKREIQRRAMHRESVPFKITHKDLILHFYKYLSHLNFVDPEVYETFFPLPFIQRIFKKYDKEFSSMMDGADDSIGESTLAREFVHLMLYCIEHTKFAVLSDFNGLGIVQLSQVRYLTVDPNEEIRVHLKENPAQLVDEDDYDDYDPVDYDSFNGGVIFGDGEKMKISKLDDLVLIAKSPLDEQFQEYIYNKEGLEELTNLLQEKSESAVLNSLKEDDLCELAEELMEDVRDIVLGWNFDMVTKEEAEYGHTMLNDYGID